MTNWQTSPGPEDGSGASVRQVVAFNLARARKDRGWTQERLGKALEEVTGTRWSRATVSHAEAGWSAEPGRVRHFDVNEVAAFALVLRLPIQWFFLPPGAQPTGYPPSSDQDSWISTREHDHAVAMSRDTFATMVLAPANRADAEDLFHARVRDEFASVIGPDDSGKASVLLERITALLEDFKSEKS